MLHQIMAIAIKEIKVLLKDRGSIIALFGLPIAFILVMTTALEGVFSSGSDEQPITMLVSNQDRGVLAEQVLEDLRDAGGLTLIETMDGQHLTAEKIDELITARDYILGLDFPANFSDAVLNLEPDSSAIEQPVIRFIVDPTANNQILAPARGMVEGYVERVISYARMEAQTLEGFDEIAMSVPDGQKGFVKQIAGAFTSGQKDAVLSTGVDYQVVSPKQYKISSTPTSVEQNVPAYTIYGVFFIIQTIAVSIFEEKNSGAFRRLKSAPLSKTTYLLGKGLSYYTVNLVQVTLMFTVGVLVFHLNLGNSPLSLVVISLVTSLASTGMGMMMTCFVKSLEQANSVGTMLGVVLSVVGGMMVPSYVMPEFMQKLSLFTPHAWALSAYQDIIVRGLDLPRVLPNLGILGLFALGFWGIAIWRFKFE